MRHSNKAMVDIVEKAKKDRNKLTHITDKSKLSTQDIVKLALCRHFVQFAVSGQHSLTDISKMTGIPVTRLSEITKYKIGKFTVDQLLKNLSMLAEHDPQIKEYLILLGKAAEVPAMPVRRIRKLSKDLEASSGLA